MLMDAVAGDHADEAGVADLHELTMAAVGAAAQKASWGGPLLQLQVSKLVQALYT
jgi:hypothetical protein